eukprot:ANDGO_00977.mRNA.1 hypothetical protein
MSFRGSPSPVQGGGTHRSGIPSRPGTSHGTPHRSSLTGTPNPARSTGRPAPLTDGDDAEELKEEIKFLQRKVRILEDAHSADVKKHALSDSQHKATIERLREDSKRLRDELLQRRLDAAGPTSVKAAINEAERILQLQREVERVKRMFDDERSARLQSDEEVKRLDALLLQHKEIVQNLTANDPLRDDLVAARTIARLETRLDVVKRTASDRRAQLENVKHFEADYNLQIQQLQTEIKKLQREVKRRERSIQELEFSHRQSEAARDAAQSEVAAITLQFESEKMQWQQEMRIMDERLRANRRVAETLLRDQKKVDTTRDKDGVNGSNAGNASSSKDSNSDTSQNNASAHDLSAVRRDTADPVLVDRLRTTLGCSTADEALERSLDLQNANDGLLRFNNELGEENHRLQRQLEEWRAAQQNGNGVGTVSNGSTTDPSSSILEGSGSSASASSNAPSHNQLIKQLEDQLTESQASYDRLSAKYEKLSRLYVDVKAGVEALCAHAAVDISAIKGDTIASADQNLYATVADDKVLLMLQRLEVKVLDLQAELQKKSSSPPTPRESAGSSHGAGAGAGAGGSSAKRGSTASTDDQDPYAAVGDDSTTHTSPLYDTPASPKSSSRTSASHASASPAVRDNTISVHNVSKFLNQMVEESDSDDDSNELLDRSRLKELSMQKVKEKEAEEADERQRKHRFQKSRRRQHE